MKVIIQQRYWYEDYQSQWADIADELGMTISRVKRLCNVIIRLFSEATGCFFGGAWWKAAYNRDVLNL